MRNLDTEPAGFDGNMDEEQLFDREVLQDDDDLLMVHCLLGNACSTLRHGAAVATPNDTDA